MVETRKGAFRIAQVWGISVFVHWTWLVVAYVEIESRRNAYQSPVWNVIEYLSLMVIVLMHEFGHALACRQVGGIANEVMLWPLGGVAYTVPPPRPGASLWTFAAGPLVNGLLIPLTLALYAAASAWPAAQGSDLLRYLGAITFLNIFLLVFNLLPIYPLDGGQVLQAILWFVVGRVWSLRIVSALGLVVGLTIGALCLLARNGSFALLALFVIWRSAAGWRLAHGLSQQLAAVRHTGYACPACRSAPPAGEFWACAKCHRRFDTFAEFATCPGCGDSFAETQCPACHARHPLEAWMVGTPFAPDETAESPLGSQV